MHIWAFAAQMCIVGVVVTNESNMVSYFPEVENLNGSNADMCSDVGGLSSGGSGDLFDFGSSSRSRTFTFFPPLLALMAAILDLSMAKTPRLPFGACYIRMHKIYYLFWMDFDSNLSKQVIFSLDWSHSHMYNLGPCYCWDEAPVKVLLRRKEFIAKCLKNKTRTCY